MSTDDDGLRREVLAHAGSRWSLGIIHALGSTEHCVTPMWRGG